MRAATCIIIILTAKLSVSSEIAFHLSLETVISCEKLSYPENGDVKFDGVTVGSTALYSCIDGFTLRGNSTRKCLGSGIWSGEKPKCELMRCGRLTSPANGDVSMNGTIIGSEASYSCRNGFELKGVRTRQCQSSKQWSDSEPVCTSKNFAYNVQRNEYNHTVVDN